MAHTPEINPFDLLDAIAPTVTMRDRSVMIAGRIAQGLMFFCDPVAAEGQKTVPQRFAQAAAYVNARIDPRLYQFWNAHEPYVASKTITLSPPRAPLDLLEEWEASGSLNAFCQKLWAGDNRGESPPTRMLTFFHQTRYEGPTFTHKATTSSFQLNMPLPWLAEQGQAGLVQTLFRDLCTILEPRSAYGGLIMATPLNISILQGGNQAVLKPILDTHPGLMVGEAFWMESTMRFDMSAVNWLTAVDAMLLDRCGGREAVQAQLDLPGIQTREMGPGGLMIQAGPSPQLGHTGEGVTLPHYGAVARALKPARLDMVNRRPELRTSRGAHVKDYGSELAEYDQDLLSTEQNAWLARFDAH